jgi:hypothetical protein
VAHMPHLAILILDIVGHTKRGATMQREDSKQTIRNNNCFKTTQMQ